MYDEIITIHQQELQTQQDNELILQCSRAVGFEINKDELITAISYDRDQYNKGYKDGLNSYEKWKPICDELPTVGEKVMAFVDFGTHKMQLIAKYVWECYPEHRYVWREAYSGEQLFEGVVTHWHKLLPDP